MKISVGADHAGYERKQQIVGFLRSLGHEVLDRGTLSTESTDYPDYAAQVGYDIVEGRADRGILVCSTGVGMSIAANKVAGVRAALAFQPEQVRLTREHNDANVLAIGAKYTDETQARDLAGIFLETPFLGGRHARRVAKIADLEQARVEHKETQSND